jgi:serine/threonine-protein kinase RsbW
MKHYEISKITLPNKLEYLDMAQLFVRETAKKIGFSGNLLNHIDLAIEESVTNVMKHTFDAEENRTFDIICENTGNGIKIIIKEMGLPFDPSNVKKFQPADNLDDANASGLGLFLLDKVMDEYSFHNLGIEGKETHFIKYLPNSKELSELNLQMAEVIEEPKIIQEKIEYSVRGMEDHEAVEISRCAYKSHGYSFFDEHIYFPEKLVELNNDNTMISAVAVTKDNIFMGHAALLYQYPEDTIAELTFVFVNVEYRGQGAFNKLIEYLFNAPKKRVLKGLYAYAVANHIFTQKAMVRYKINDCGILLATSPSSWKFKGISDDTTQRISVVLSFKYMMEPAPKTLYLPAKHSAIIIKLYNNIGGDVHNYQIPAFNKISLPDECEISTSVNELESCGEIHIHKYGMDIVKKVRLATRQMCVKNVASINLFLSLEDEATAFVTQEIEKLGYFFAGILPESKIGDVLILQYLNNVDFDYSKVTAYSAIAKEILEYIKLNDPNNSED